MSYIYNNSISGPIGLFSDTWANETKYWHKYYWTSVGNVLIVELGNWSEFLKRIFNWWQLKRMWLVGIFPLHIHSTQPPTTPLSHQGNPLTVWGPSPNRSALCSVTLHCSLPRVGAWPNFQASDSSDQKLIPVGASTSIKGRLSWHQSPIHTPSTPVGSFWHTARPVLLFCTYVTSLLNISN